MRKFSQKLASRAFIVKTCVFKYGGRQIGIFGEYPDGHRIHGDRNSVDNFRRLRHELAKYSDRKFVEIHTVRVLGNRTIKALPNSNLTLFDWETEDDPDKRLHYVKRQIPKKAPPKELTAGDTQPNVALILTHPDLPAIDSANDQID